MTTEMKRPKPTTITLRVTNPGQVELPLPTSGYEKIGPGQTTTLTVPVQKLLQVTANSQLEVERIGDNAAQLLAAEQDRANRIKDARDRLDNLRETLNERRAEEQEIAGRLAALEAEEKAAGDADRAALRAAGRSPQATATGVLVSTGATSDERRGLRFDLWGAELHRLEAEAAFNDAASLVAADETVKLRRRVAAAERALEEAQTEVESAREAADQEAARPDELSQKARILRSKIARLEASGPEQAA